MTAASNPRTMMGFDTVADQKIPIFVRDWSAAKLALWRSKRGLEIAARAAIEIVERCRHLDGCPGRSSDSEPCIAPRYQVIKEGEPAELVQPGCPDREQRMSALVILGAAQMLAPISARKIAEETYFAPSRERYSEVIAELAAAQAELEALRARAGPVEPPPNEHLATLPSPPPPAAYLEEFGSEESPTEKEEEE